MKSYGREITFSSISSIGGMLNHVPGAFNICLYYRIRINSFSVLAIPGSITVLKYEIYLFVKECVLLSMIVALDHLV